MEKIGRIKDVVKSLRFIIMIVVLVAGIVPATLYCINRLICMVVTTVVSDLH